MVLKNSITSIKLFEFIFKIIIFLNYERRMLGLLALPSCRNNYSLSSPFPLSLLMSVLFLLDWKGKLERVSTRKELK